jgi:hypothetical protein
MVKNITVYPILQRSLEQVYIFDIEHYQGQRLLVYLNLMMLCYEKEIFHMGKYGFFVLNKALAEDFQACREKHNLMYNQESIKQKYKITI